MTTINDYTLRQKIGSGFSADVYLAKKQSEPRQLVALKVFHEFDNELQQRILHDETYYSSNLDHKNIIKPIEAQTQATLKT